MTDEQVAESCSELGVEGEVTLDTLQKAYLKKSYALIRAGAPDEQRERIKAVHGALAAHLDARRRAIAAGDEVAAPAVVRSAGPVYVHVERPNPFDLSAFDRPVVNAVVPPLVVGLALLVAWSPFGFFLTGFHVWVHEFGHATVAWMTGKRALPLPIGW